jgi:hypothetical protein
VVGFDTNELPEYVQQRLHGLGMVVYAGSPEKTYFECGYPDDGVVRITLEAFVFGGSGVDWVERELS